MTVRDITVSPSWGTNAAFKAEAVKIADALKAVIGPRTADTGQIDFATTTFAGVANTIAGYEMYALAASGTAPALRLKVEYGCDAVLNQAGVWMQMGTGSDGAGTLTGTLGPRYRVVGNGGYSVNAALTQCLFSSDGSTYFWCMLFKNYLGTENRPGMIFAFDRARNVDGTASPDGWLNIWQYHDYNSGTADTATRTNSQMVNLKAGLSSAPNSQPLQSCAFFGNYASLAAGNDLYFFPHFFANPQVYSASPVALGYVKTEVTQGTVLSVVVYGSPRNFYAMGLLTHGWSINANPAHGAALRWEV